MSSLMLLQQSSWNLEAQSLYTLVKNYGDSLNANGGLFSGAGFVLQTSSSSETAPEVSVNIYGAACPDTCVNPTAPPTTSICTNVTASLAQGSSWVQDGVTASVYTLTVTNNGDCPLLYYTTGFGYFPGTVLQTWNLESSRGGYLVTGYIFILMFYPRLMLDLSNSNFLSLHANQY